MRRLRRVGAGLVAPVLLILAVGGRRRVRRGSAGALLTLWVLTYLSYRRRGRAQTAREWEILGRASAQAFTRHYNERVPTIEEEFELWGAYHQHRHEMRYDLVAGLVRTHLPAGGVVLDVGCGSALVAERIADLAATYVGLDFGGHQYTYAATKLGALNGPLRGAVLAGDGEHLPLADCSTDVVVMSEVLEHLLRPELAVWEVARVLRPGGVFIMTTNNASEMPCRSPLTNPLAWVEKAVAADHPSWMSLRPWVWPEPVDPALLPPGAPPIHLPHTHHIAAETAELFRVAGLETAQWSTFEFPPPQSSTARWLDGRGALGQELVDLIEAVATRTPGLRRMGCHLLMVARKSGSPVAPSPPPGVWPGPFSMRDRPFSAGEGPFSGGPGAAPGRGLDGRRSGALPGPGPGLEAS